MKTKKKIRYVSLEPGAFISDLSFLSMTAEEKGVYLSIILCLYENDGFLPMDEEIINRFCNCTNFEKVFEKIKHKFLIKDGKISHKRVLRELRRARKISQLLHNKGVKANEIRWKNHPKGNPQGVPDESTRSPQGIPKRSEGEAKGSEDKRREEKRSEAKDASPSGSSNGSSPRLASPANSTSESSSEIKNQTKSTSPIPIDFTMKLIYLNDELCKIFPQRTPADTSSIRNLANWVINRIKLGFLQDKIIGNVLAIARDSKKGKSRKPIAVFYSQLKTDLGYKQDG